MKKSKMYLDVSLFASTRVKHPAFFFALSDVSIDRFGIFYILLRLLG